jgi:hypothetical protein
MERKVPGNLKGKYKNAFGLTIIEGVWEYKQEKNP